MRGEFLDVEGARLYYYAAGSRGTGEPVVFLHGFPTSGHLWGDVVSLMPAGHRLVVLDLLGYGRSDRPLSRPVDILSHAGRVVQVLDELRIDRACIVGHGVGGGVAQSIAVRQPHRVTRLGLVDSISFEHWPTRTARAMRTMIPLARLLSPQFMSNALRRRLRRGYTDADRAARSLDLYLRPFRGPEGRDALLAHVRAFGPAEPLELVPELRGIHVPTAVMWGQHDPVIPVAVGRRLQQSIPGATLQVVSGARHFLPEEAPREVADALAGLLTR